jgi:sporulation protein YlmC with PRC-barrel domain
MSEERLKKFGQLGDYAVAPGDPDPRGWRVDSSDGRRLGSVADLIVNTDSMEAEYLDVEIDPRLTPGADRARHLVVPISAVRVGLEERNEQRVSISKKAAEVVVRMSSLTCRRLRSLGVNEREWIAAGRGACHVRLTRPGSDG